jgi:hypothetical protein
MVWTPPSTFVADQLVSQADLNAQIRDNLLILAVAIDTATGKIPAISSTYFASLSAANLTGIALLSGTNTYTSGKQDFSGGASTRVVLPTGASKWAT